MTLTKPQKLWLKRMDEKGSLSVRMDKPPLRVMYELQEKGLCKNIMDTFFDITEEGRKHLST
ncbi:hypothetical protein MXM51_01655 [Pantoea stewartii]|uniref:hypothetical protein n=1 Tax=Pantoea stewartii TaxID=66269 RepID=UPI002DBE3ED4|nr:hypothetical protein [Pantoea stewartii]MEB6533255.1 hypothetical protein [Pantoea stewartii]